MDEFRHAWEGRFHRLDTYLRRIQERLKRPQPANGHKPCGSAKH